MNDITVQLHTIFTDRLKENEPMGKYTNFRIGGPARWMVEAKTEDEVERAVRIAREAGVALFVMGGGSNTLVSDAGFDGLVVRVAMRDYHIEPSTLLRSASDGQAGSGNMLVTAGAGAISAALARATVEAGLQGLEWAISLPGTIGGAVRGNAGCFGGEMKDVVKAVRVLRGPSTLLRSASDGQAGSGNIGIIELKKDDLKFGYRESAIKHSDDIVLSVMLELKPGNVTELKEKLNATLGKRKASQPLYAGSAGCIFKNPPGRSAGQIIDELGLKGTKIGKAQVSGEHGNFIINLGGATADDVVQLISLIKMKARDEAGIALQEEVHYLGF